MLSEHQIPAFKKAKPIYPHILEKEMNVSLFFVQEVNIQKKVIFKLQEITYIVFLIMVS